MIAHPGGIVPRAVSIVSSGFEILSSQYDLQLESVIEKSATMDFVGAFFFNYKFRIAENC